MSGLRLLLALLVLEGPLHGLARTCTFKVFDSQTFPNTVTGSEVEAVTNSACALECEVAPTCIGYAYNHDAGTCKLVTRLPEDRNYNSGFCVKKGGCDGNQRSECVWLRYQDVDVAAIMSHAESVVRDVPTPYEAMCKTSCEQLPDCTAYSWHKQNGTSAVGDYHYHKCRMYTSLQTRQKDMISAMCLRGMRWKSNPEGCWSEEVCKGQPTLEVPMSVRGERVSLQMLPRTDQGGNLFGNVTVTASNGIATFKDIGFQHYGQAYRLVAQTQEIECPAYSLAFDVEDLDHHTIWRWNSEFEGTTESNHNFLLVRPKKSCALIVFFLMFLVYSFAITVIKIFTKGLLALSPKVGALYCLVALVLLVFAHDFKSGWTMWSCDANGLV